MRTDDPQIRVFVSYAQHSDRHSDAVLALAQALRGDGIAVALDRFHGHELIDWPRWCREQLAADRARWVLMICSAVYRDRLENRVDPHTGKGVFWEGALLDDELYESKGNRRIVPVLLHDEFRRVRCADQRPCDSRGGRAYDQGRAALYRQHTDATGQPFAPGAIDRVWYWTCGQPWLVNALGYEVAFRRKDLRERRRTIDGEAIDAAAETLIQRRNTHLDQLTDKLREPRVQRVVEAILTGDEERHGYGMHDVEYLIDLGLIRRAPGGRLIVANPIYREIIPRDLTWVLQSDIHQETRWYLRPDGRLDFAKLLAAFQEFFREHSEHWIERFDYKEAGPQLLMQAFLQRIVNGGGRIEREYGLGRMRTDLLVIWPHPGGVQKVVIELKLLHKSLERTLAAGLAQTWTYCDKSGADEAHLVIFDRSDRPWEEKVFQRIETHRGRSIGVLGM